MDGAPARVIRTVLGDIPPEELGVTMAHEHLVIDYYAYVRAYHGIVYDEDLMIDELALYKKAGGQAIIDMTNIGIGRSPRALERISRETGIHVVMGSAWYRELTYPSYIQEKSTNELADMIVRDILEGVDGTSVRSGLIGEIGTERYPISPAQERVFRAAARAHRRTDAPIVTHTTHFGTWAHEQLDLLQEEGVDPRRVIISHLGDRRDPTLLLELGARGAWLAIDRVGFLQDQRDEVRARHVARLVEEGYLHQLLLSMDICDNLHLNYFGGRGFDHLLVNFVPLLKAEGLGDGEIQTLLVDNPARAFAFCPPDAQGEGVQGKASVA